MQVDKNYSDYIIYVDESGDHGLVSIDPQYPIFVLVFCIFKKEYFCNEVVPSFKKLKFDYWGHDSIILHSRDMRKKEGEFTILNDPSIGPLFTEELTDKVGACDFTVISTVINKNNLENHPDYRLSNPYNIALQFCMERAYQFLEELGQHAKTTHIVIEKRGKKEDGELELQFRRICDSENWGIPGMKFEPVFADKRHNSIGLQIADLVAHPVGRNAIKPEQQNRAYDVIKTKFRRGPLDIIKGYGLKEFP